MPADIRMTLNERRKYLLRMRLRYVQANRTERSRLLDEMKQVTELHRKSLLRLMKDEPARKPREQQRGRSYGHEVDDVIRVVAESLDYICAERLAPGLVPTAELLVKHGELTVSPEVFEQLGRISISTVKRILTRLGQDERRLPRRGPERAQRLLHEIPALRIPWDIQEPGHFEVDLVHHGGPSSSGEYLHTLQMTDVATGWSERVAVLGRSALVMEAGFRRILARLPFPIIELHPDNGSEFLNHHLLKFFKDTVKGIRISRSRPWQKNDNCHVEQRNQSLVRAYLGYDRLDSVAQALAVNQLYDQMWLYYNLFQPVLHISEKILVVNEGQRPHVKRRYDTASTPFDRLCASTVLLTQRQQELAQVRQQTNPRHLHRQVHTLLDYVLALPAADSQQDVRQTLAALAEPVPWPMGCQVMG
jgi:transposase InsO family protein